MKEKMPEQFFKKEKTENHLDIPLYEKLDEKSQEFVAEIKELSDISEERFLEKYPNTKKTIDYLKEFWGNDFWEKPKHIPMKIITREDVLGEKFAPVSSDDMTDKSEYFATMWDLVRLHLLELKDFQEFKKPGFYSKQTDYLAEKISGQALKVDPFKFPGNERDLICEALNNIQQTDDTGQKIKAIHLIINAMHLYQVPERSMFPPVLEIVKDIWRYAVVKINKPRKTSAYKCAKHFNDFFNKMSNINLLKET